MGKRLTPEKVERKRKLAAEKALQGVMKATDSTRERAARLVQVGEAAVAQGARVGFAPRMSADLPTLVRTLLKGGQLGPEHVKAADRYVTDVRAASGSSVGVQRYAERIDGGRHGGGAMLGQAASSGALDDARLALGTFRAVVDAVLVMDVDLSKVEVDGPSYANGAARRAVVVTWLRLGLDALAVFYGFRKGA